MGGHILGFGRVGFGMGSGWVRWVWGWDFGVWGGIGLVCGLKGWGLGLAGLC